MDPALKHITWGEHARGSVSVDAGSGAENGSTSVLRGVCDREDFSKQAETNTQREMAGKYTAHVALPPSARLLTIQPDPVVVESYRRLRTKLLQLQAERPFRSLVVTSPSPQEGKTLTCINLGLSLAMLSSFRVLLVDGDLRRGTLGEYLGAEDQPGLSNLLDSSASLQNVLFEASPSGVHFLLRGTATASPAELLNSVQLKACMRSLTDRFDFVIVDSPPVNLLTDVQLIANSCDAVLLVARSFSTTRKSLESAARELRSFNVIGSVLNGVPPTREYKKFREYYYPERKK